MLKVMMARPVGDTIRQVRGGDNGGVKEITARSPNYHLVHGSVPELLNDRLAGTQWFHFVNTVGKRLLVNADHIAWIEEVDEGRQSTQPS